MARQDSEKRLILQKLDFRSVKDVDNVVAKIDQLMLAGHLNNLFALINNADVLTYGEFDWLTWDHIQNQIDVNLVSTLRLTRALLP